MEACAWLYVTSKIKIPPKGLAGFEEVINSRHDRCQEYPENSLEGTGWLLHRYLLPSGDSLKMKSKRMKQEVAFIL